MCGRPAAAYANVALCTDHQLDFRKWLSTAKSSVARQTAEHHDLNDFPGLCYIALFSDATVKIGYSNTAELLKRRLQVLSNESGSPVVPLAIVRGGFVAEAVLHHRFSDHRIWEQTERFAYSAEMAEYIGSLTADDLVHI